MNYFEKIGKILVNQNGTILSSDLDENNIPRAYLSMMVAEGEIERIDRGVYVSVDSIEDEMFILQKKYSSLIFSHETALFLHGLTDRTPFEYSATVISGYKVVEAIRSKTKIYYIKKDLHKLGVIEHKTSFGNPIQVYNIERTICDILRSRNRIDIQIFTDALKGIAKNRTIDFNLLYEYAKTLKVDKVLNTYMEVLL